MLCLDVERYLGSYLQAFYTFKHKELLCGFKILHRYFIFACMWAASRSVNLHIKWNYVCLRLSGVISEDFPIPILNHEGLAHLMIGKSSHERKSENISSKQENCYEWERSSHAVHSQGVAKVWKPTECEYKFLRCFLYSDTGRFRLPWRPTKWGRLCGWTVLCIRNIYDLAKPFLSVWFVQD